MKWSLIKCCKKFQLYFVHWFWSVDPWCAHYVRDADISDDKADEITFFHPFLWRLKVYIWKYVQEISNCHLTCVWESEQGSWNSNSNTYSYHYSLNGLDNCMPTTAKDHDSRPFQNGIFRKWPKKLPVRCGYYKLYFP